MDELLKELIEATKEWHSVEDCKTEGRLDCRLCKAIKAAEQSVQGIGYSVRAIGDSGAERQPFGGTSERSHTALPAGFDKEQVKYNVYAFGRDVRKFTRKRDAARKPHTREHWQKKVDEYTIYLNDNKGWLAELEAAEQ